MSDLLKSIIVLGDQLKDFDNPHIDEFDIQHNLHSSHINYIGYQNATNSQIQSNQVFSPRSFIDPAQNVKYFNENKMKKIQEKRQQSFKQYQIITKQNLNQKIHKINPHQLTILKDSKFDEYQKYYIKLQNIDKQIEQKLRQRQFFEVNNTGRQTNKIENYISLEDPVSIKNLGQIHSIRGNRLQTNSTHQQTIHQEEERQIPGTIIRNKKMFSPIIRDFIPQMNSKNQSPVPILPPKDPSIFSRAPNITDKLYQKAVQMSTLSLRPADGKLKKFNEKKQKIDKIIEKCTQNNYIDPINQLKIKKQDESIRKIDESLNKKVEEPDTSKKTLHYVENQSFIKASQKRSNSEQLSDLSLSDNDELEEKDNSIDSTIGMSQVYKQGDKVLLLKSIYEGRPSTVFFPYPPQCMKVRDDSRCVKITKFEEESFSLKYKIVQVPYKCVVRSFQYAGFTEAEYKDYNVYWGLNKKHCKDLNKFQKVNHFSGCWNLGRKDSLWKNLVKFQRKFSNEFDFIPNTYLLSSQQDWERFTNQRKMADKNNLWIMKPVNSACGRGVYMINKKTKLVKKKDYLVCEYVTNPHLINGLKYDLRIYVLVTSYDPLKIYMYDEGLTRFATEQYSTNMKELSKRYIHLTNWSVNKYSKKFQVNQNAEQDGEGSKWSLTALRKEYIKLGIDEETLFKRIKDLIVKTCIAVESNMMDSMSKLAEHRNNCFELYGFDVLVDADLKPWILEVNVCPSLCSSSPLDRKIKHSLISDMLNLIGVIPYDKQKFMDDQKKKVPGFTKPKERGPLISKNLNEIKELNAQNCIDMLGPDDWNILFEADEEYHRRGSFERIYPVKESVEYYSNFFEYPRYNNVIISKWLQSPVNFLEQILKKRNNQKEV